MAKIYYDDFFKLCSNPFGETPDPCYYFESKTHQRALSTLLQGIEQGKGFSVLTGEVGVGKTLISRILLQSVAEKADSALILYPNCTDAELIRSICKELEIALESPRSLTSGHKAELDRLNEFLLSNAQKGRKTVMLIDETQNMPARTLETVRLLSNLETNCQKLIHTILCAQPEFLKRLAQEDMRQLRQRISVNVKLESLDITETEAYVKHRVECAGGSNFLRFEGEACSVIWKFSGGLPRNINRLCDRLLSLARKRGVRLISKAMAKEVAGLGAKNQWIGKLWPRQELLQP